MVEVLPITSLRDDDATIFGDLNVLLAKLSHDLPVAKGYVISPPELHLKTLLEHFDFKSHEVFEESLTLVKKELEKTPVPEVLQKTFADKKLLVGTVVVKSVSELWKTLLFNWVEDIKYKLWNGGFSPDLAENLESQIVIVVNKLEASGSAHLNRDLSEVIIEIHEGKISPVQTRKLDDLIIKASKKALLSYKFRWILDGELKLIQIQHYTPSDAIIDQSVSTVIPDPIGNPESFPINWIPHQVRDDKVKSTVKVYLDLSTGMIVEPADGIFIDSSKIFDLNKPKDSFEELTFKVVDTASTFPTLPVLMKLADKSEGMGKVRGTLRLLHQKNLLDPLLETLEFAKDKKQLQNICLVIPFARGVTEVMELKKRFAVKKLTRTSIPHWLEMAVPENILNLEDYLLTGLDGVVLNLDELIAHLNGFDPLEQELTHYKHEVTGLINFLEDSLKILHRSNIPFIAFGTLTLNPKVLDFLVEKGVAGVIVERYEASSVNELLHLSEKRMVLRKAS